jgi:hypothetical protein
MIEVARLSGEAAKELNDKIHLILDAALPPFTAEKDFNVQVNALSMMFAIVLREVSPDQHDDFIADFGVIAKVHLDMINQTAAKAAVTAFFALVEALSGGRTPGDDTTH